MVTILSKINVDTLKVSETAIMQIGDTIEVSANITPTKPPELCPISWCLGQVPKPPSQEDCLIQIGMNPFAGTMTFKAIGLGNGYVKYDFLEGDKKSKTLQIEIV
jgi:hypothetical protein